MNPYLFSTVLNLLLCLIMLLFVLSQIWSLLICKQAPMSLGCVPLIILSTFFPTQDAILYPLCVSPGVKKEIVLFLFEAVDSF